MSAALALTENEVVELTATMLQKVYRGRLKLVARDAGVGPDTAKNWTDRRNAPQLVSFLNLIRQSPEFRAEAMRLMDPEAEFDEDFVRATMMLMRAWRSRGERS